MKHIVFTVTTDLNFDQRMQRICSSLARNGYQVTLVGRERKSSRPLYEQPFCQKRIRCLFEKSFLFYAEYNIRLFFFLLRTRMSAICAIDLDTILPCLFISKIKSIPRIYDAHEFFTELKEVRARPVVRKVWTQIAKFAIPKFAYGYTVSEGLQQEFKKQYHRNYALIRNISVLESLSEKHESAVIKKFIVYQGAVNEGRGFEYLIPAMKKINYPLVICGDGNFMPQLKKLITANGVESKVELKGMLAPAQLRSIALQASLGINLVEKEGLNQYYSLPNKFFDYVHARLPQLAMNYPEYKKLNDEYHIAVLIDDLNPNLIATTINGMIADKASLNELSANCSKARLALNWQNEEQKLLAFYQRLFLA